MQKRAACEVHLGRLIMKYIIARVRAVVMGNTAEVYIIVAEAGVSYPFSLFFVYLIHYSLYSSTLGMIKNREG